MQILKSKTKKTNTEEPSAEDLERRRLIEERTKNQEKFFEKYPMGSKIEYLSKQMKVCEHIHFTIPTFHPAPWDYNFGKETAIKVRYFDKNDILHDVEIEINELM